MSPPRFVYFALFLALLCPVSPRVRAQASDPAEPASDAPPLDFTGDGAVAPEAAPPSAEPPVPQPLRVVSPPPVPLVVAPREPERPARVNAINLSVLGFVIGNIRVTYERLLLPKHGVFAEAIVAPDFLRGFDYVGAGGGLGYRFHWHGAATSGFVGASLSVMRHAGTTPTIKLGDKDTHDFSGSAWTIGVAPHVGKRWLFERSGVNLTLRFGGGFAYHFVDPDPGSERKANRTLKHTYLMTDGELSVGYSF